MVTKLCQEINQIQETLILENDLEKNKERIEDYFRAIISNIK